MITEILSSIKAISGLQRPLKTNYHRTFIPVQKNLSHINDEIDLTEREKQLLSHPPTLPLNTHTQAHTHHTHCFSVHMHIDRGNAFYKFYYSFFPVILFLYLLSVVAQFSQVFTVMYFDNVSETKGLEKNSLGPRGTKRIHYILKRAQATHYWWQSQVIFPWFFRANQPS